MPLSIAKGRTGANGSPAKSADTGDSTAKKAAEAALHGAAAAAQSAAPHVRRGATEAWTALSTRRGLRTGLLGFALVLVAIDLGGGSALSVPLFVIGALMLATGALGPRLHGSLAIEWGADGTEIQLSTRIDAPDARLRRRPEMDAAQAEEPGAVLGETAAGTSEPKVIEGRADTIEVDVAELAALLDAGRSAPDAGR